jgi:hypothetical protein
MGSATGSRINVYGEGEVAGGTDEKRRAIKEGNGRIKRRI